MNGIHEVRGSIPLGSTNNMPIIVGAPRSGTTLLRFMLDAHLLTLLVLFLGIFSGNQSTFGFSCL